LAATCGAEDEGKDEGLSLKGKDDNEDEDKDERLPLKGGVVGGSLVARP